MTLYLYNAFKIMLIPGMDCPQTCIDADGNSDWITTENRLPGTYYPLIHGNIPIAKAMLEKYGTLNMCAYSDVSVLNLCK